MTDPTPDEAKWRQRLLVMTFVKLSGVAFIALGLVIALTSLIVPGGNRIFGALVIVIGTFDAAFAPLLVKRGWDRQP